MKLKRMQAAVVRTKDISPTAREVVLALPEQLGFLPGSFVNVFMQKDGKKERRAYSISSSEAVQNRITLSIRKGREDGMSIRFWDPAICHEPIEIMGPLGINTADKITRRRVFLFTFGIGVSVAKGLIEHLLRRTDIEEIRVITGSRTEEEILYREYFEELASSDARLKVRFVVSRPQDSEYQYKGHIQDYIADYDFTNATVYLCGTLAACSNLKSEIETRSKDVEFLVEAFD